MNIRASRVPKTNSPRFKIKQNMGLANNQIICISYVSETRVYLMHSVSTQLAATKNQRVLEFPKIAHAKVNISMR